MDIKDLFKKLLAQITKDEQHNTGVEHHFNPRNYDPRLYQQPYVTIGSGTALTAERALTAGNNITITDNGAGSSVIITAAGSGNVNTVSNLDGTLTISPTTGTVVASLANNVAIPGSPTTTTQATTDNSTKIATTSYVTTAIANAVAGVNPATAVQVSTTTILPNSPTYTAVAAGIGDTLTAGVTNTTLVIDGYTPLLNDRVLVKNQASAYQNGVYFVSQLAGVTLAWILTRALDYDQPSDVNNTGAIPVINGTVNVDTSWVLTSKITSIGPSGSNFTYTQFSLNPTTIVTGAGNLSPLFTTSTGSNTISFTLSNAAPGTALMGPVSGASAPSTYRAIQGQDIYAAISAGNGIATSITGSTLTLQATGFAQTIGHRLSIQSTSAYSYSGTSLSSNTIYLVPYHGNLATIPASSGISYQIPVSTLAYVASSNPVQTLDLMLNYSGSTATLVANQWLKYTATSSPTAGSSKVISLTNTTGINLYDIVGVQDSVTATKCEEAVVTAIVTNTSITVATLANSYTTPTIFTNTSNNTYTNINGQLCGAVNAQGYYNLFLGTIRTNASGNCLDGIYNRWISNFYNTVPAILEAYSSSSFTTASTTAVVTNGTTVTDGTNAFSFVCQPYVSDRVFIVNQLDSISPSTTGLTGSSSFAQNYFANGLLAYPFTAYTANAVGGCYFGASASYTGYTRIIRTCSTSSASNCTFGAFKPIAMTGYF